MIRFQSLRFIQILQGAAGELGHETKFFRAEADEALEAAGVFGKEMHHHGFQEKGPVAGERFRPLYHKPIVFLDENGPKAPPHLPKLLGRLPNDPPKLVTG